MEARIYFMRTQIHVHTGVQTDCILYISLNIYTQVLAHIETQAVLNGRALSLDATMYLSRSPCCHAAVVRSTHYVVSCDSISESFGPGSWTKREKKNLTVAAKLRWQRKRAKTKSLSLQGLHKKFHRCQSCTNKRCPPETSSLQRNRYSVWSSAQDLLLQMQACIVCVYVHAVIQFRVSLL